jgi:excisionase family DNA binding protein
MSDNKLPRQPGETLTDWTLRFLADAQLADPLLTQSEVCALLGISVKTLQVWRRQGKVLFARLGYRTIRIRQSQVLQLVRESQL